MSIEQEINRNTMTIAELVKAVRELTEAIKGAGAAAARMTIDTVQVGEVSSTKATIAPVAATTSGTIIPVPATQRDLRPGEVLFASPNVAPIEPDTRPFAEVVAEQVVEEAKPADQSRYFHDTVHRAAYKIAPTEPLNGLQARAGVEEINAEQYAALKAEYAKPTDQVIAGNAEAAPAAAAPTTTGSEPPPSAPEPAAPPAEAPVAEPSWPEVHATLMRLVKTAGCGAPQLIALLEDFGVKRPETALALQTKAVGRFAEIIANAERRMKGGAA